MNLSYKAADKAKLLCDAHVAGGKICVIVCCLVYNVTFQCSVSYVHNSDIFSTCLVEVLSNSAILIRVASGLHRRKV